MEKDKFKRLRRFVYGLTIVLSIAGIYIATQLNRPFIGAILIIASLLSCYRGIRYIGYLERDEIIDDPRITRHRQESANVIYVSIVDDAGNLLPDAEAKAKVRRAEAQAGPRDTVVAVKHKV
ncbi:hypothetical protein [Herpetosiphon sp. NSE202]|uniref:hypothetical protein n=1 Tax=Herpetosiphon sp. NSE202 TaxID=3351349 RepID=UPI003628419A